jgi:sec-independent protein translocase protein TatB
MIDISLGKLLLIAFIALIVLGPEKLPGAARTAGALMRRMRTGWDSVRAEVGRELEVEEIRRAAREVAAQAEAAQIGLKDHLQQARQPLVEVIAEIDVISTNTPTAIVAPSAGTLRRASDDIDDVRGKLALGEVVLDDVGSKGVTV